MNFVKFNAAIQQTGKNWGSARGKIFARLLRLEWESVSAIPALAGGRKRWAGFNPQNRFGFRHIIAPRKTKW